MNGLYTTELIDDAVPGETLSTSRSKPSPTPNGSTTDDKRQIKHQP